MDIIAQIESGALDADLVKIKEAVDARLNVARASRKLDDYAIGARVRFNEKTATRYMVGQYATVITKRQKKLVVRPENAVGRFARPNGVPAEVVVPLAIVDLV